MSWSRDMKKLKNALIADINVDVKVGKCQNKPILNKKNL